MIFCSFRRGVGRLGREGKGREKKLCSVIPYRTLLDRN